MLKTHVNDEFRLVQQPHHAQVSGYLAAHWGGRNGFARPGHYPGATHPERWRDEVVLGIAEHDNGWWETEASPRFNPRDGLPVGVGEAAPPTQENEFDAWRAGGFDRWRRGVERIATPSPYAALLIAMHAYWLYAVAFDDIAPEERERRRHFVFGAPDIAPGLVGDRETTRAFLDDFDSLQTTLKTRISADPEMAGAIDPAHLDPHFRLLQLLDSMSLRLALNDLDDRAFPMVPRGGGEDLRTLTWRRRDDRVIALDPYPFDVDPLPVLMPTRIVAANSKASGSPMARLHGAPLEALRFTFVDGSD